MPISYEPPQPYSAEVSRAYGAAQAMQQNTPLLAQVAQANQNARLAAASLQQRGNEAALESDSRREALAAQARQADANRRAEQEMLGARMAQQTQRDVFLAEQSRAELHDRFRLQRELADHELSVGEQMRLKRLDQAVSEVSQLPMDAATKADLIADIKTEGRSLKLRAVRAEEAQREMHARVYQEQADRIKATELRQAKLDAMTFEERTAKIPDPAVLAQVQAEFGPVSPAALAALGPAAIAEREGAIMEEVARRGGLRTFYQSSVGKWDEVKPEKAGGGKEGRPELGVDDYLKIDSEVSREVDKRVRDFELPADQRDAAIKAETARRWQEAQRVHGELAEARRPKQPGVARPFSGTSPPPPAPVEQPKPAGPRAEEFKQSLVSDLTALKAAVGGSGPAAQAADEMIAIANQDGSVDNMTVEQRDRFEAARVRLNMLRQIPTSVPGVGQPPPQPLFPGGPSIPGNVADALRGGR